MGLLWIAFGFPMRRIGQPRWNDFLNAATRQITEFPTCTSNHKPNKRQNKHRSYSCVAAILNRPRRSSPASASAKPASLKTCTSIRTLTTPSALNAGSIKTSLCSRPKPQQQSTLRGHPSAKDCTWSRFAILYAGRNAATTPSNALCALQSNFPVFSTRKFYIALNF